MNPIPPIPFVVIGSPGNGKSTLLNEIAKKDIFKVAAGGQSCTQAGGEWEARNTKIIELSDGKMNMRFKLMDTPGFPDPDQAKAGAYYDHVVQKCNGPISGVLFVFKPERKIVDVIRRYQVLMAEFINLQVPLIVVVNGTESAKRKRETDVDFQARRKAGMEQIRQVALDMLQATGLHAREVLVSFCQDELEDLGKDIARCLSASPPKASNMKTFERIGQELTAATNVKVAKQQQVDRQNQRIAKCTDDIEALKKDIKKLEAAAAGTCWIPFVGQIAAAICLAKAEDKTRRVTELCKEIGDAKGAQRAVGMEEINRQVREMQGAFNAMRQYLGTDRNVRARTQ